MLIRRPTSAILATVLCGSLVFLPFTAKQDDAAKLDNDSLKSMLDNMGYAPKALSSGYLISVKRDSWTYNMQLVLSDDQTKLGINANLGSVDDTSTVTADQWRTLLEKNESVDPSSFYFSKDQHKLYLHRVVDNRAITPEVLRVQVDHFCSDIHDTSDSWNFTK